MKNIISGVFLMGLSLFGFTQTLPNSEFELWVDYGVFQQPEQWSTPNPFTTILDPTAISVSKSTDAYAGDYSAKLETINAFGGSVTIPGVLTLAQINVDFISVSYSISGGFPLKENVSKFSGMYKYQGVAGDSATILIYNFKRDNEGEMDTIGYGAGYLIDANSWTPFTVNMQYINSHVPDTFNVIILSSGLNLQAGSTLLVDNLTIETNTGIIDLDLEQVSVNIYPNPTSDFVEFETRDIEQGRQIKIYDINGRQINISDFNNRKAQIFINEFPSGLYTYQIILKNKILNRGTFIKN
jgi:hypothetical protein